ncbi:MAG: YkgJ family cysteine cluster protein [Pyrinomonadaceae bacterium]|nr:YkgJ family cysteine cluster protein [Pyrinomonadaceae bacterium]
MAISEFVQITRQSSVPEAEFYPIVNRMYETIWGQLMPPQIPTDHLSSKLANRVVTPAETPVPDCLTCGACCQSLLCVGVRPSDKVDSELYWEITTEAESGEMVVDRYLRRNGETLACIALSGTIGEQVGCTIYETRPIMCHHFDAGSDRCHAIRRAFSIEPFLSLNEMSAAMERLYSKEGTPDDEVKIKAAQITENAENGRRLIKAFLKDERLITIHEYDPAEETWLQFEFDGLKLGEAESLINSRVKQAKEQA